MFLLDFLNFYGLFVDFYGLFQDFVGFSATYTVTDHVERVLHVREGRLRNKNLFVKDFSIKFHVKMTWNPKIQKSSDFEIFDFL